MCIGQVVQYYCAVLQEMDSIGGWQALAAQVMQEVSQDTDSVSDSGELPAVSDSSACAVQASLSSVTARPGYLNAFQQTELN